MAARSLDKSTNQMVVTMVFFSCALRFRDVVFIVTLGCSYACNVFMYQSMHDTVNNDSGDKSPPLLTKYCM